MSQPKKYKLIVEKDVAIPLRDGTILSRRCFPARRQDEKFPILLITGPYQKDKLWVPPPDLEEKAESLHELGMRQSAVVVSARLRAGARR